jgi:hypothetical protein
VGDALKGIDSADGHIDRAGAELLDRLGVTVGDLPVACGVQRAANISVGGIDGCLVCMAPTLKMVAAALMNADSAAGSMPGCYGQTGVLGQAEREQRALNWVAWRLVIIRTAGLQFGLQFIAVRTGSPGYEHAV